MSTATHARHESRRFVVALAVVAALTLGACSSEPGGSAGIAGTTTSTTTRPGSAGSGPGTPSGSVAPASSGLRLSEGRAQAAAAPLEVVSGTPLDEAGVRAVLDRLPAWVLDPSQAEPFRFPTQSAPVPRAGATVDVPFPARVDAPPPDVAGGPLHVLRFQPEGDVALAPFVTITFDQPMVPIATVGQLDGVAVPATIEPAIPGRWQWIGASTLRFDATSDVIDRLPMATDFTVTVPAGTTSATGGALAQAVTFSFATPPATVQSVFPMNDSLSLVPVLVATFDQRIDPQAVLDTIDVKADGKRREIRLATDAEVAADEQVRSSVGRLADRRWLAFRPVDPLPKDAAISVDVGPGTPSAEGAGVSVTATSFTGRTYAPLGVRSVECGYSRDCPPGSDIAIMLNNSLDPVAFDPASVVVEPAIPGVVVGVSGNVVSVRGATHGRTDYRITLPAGLTDVYGQTLGTAETRTVSVGPARPILQQFARPFTTLDPLAPSPSLSVFTVNHANVRVRVFQVTAADWPAYVTYLQQVWTSDQSKELPSPPWTAFLDEVLDTNGRPDTATETQVPLTGAIGAAHGHAVVLVEPTEAYSTSDDDFWQNRPTITWAQATSIGVDAFTDSDEVRAWTTTLADGAPLPGLDVQLLDSAGRTRDDAIVTTDADGVAVLPLPASASTGLLVTTGDDSALLPAGWFGGTWERNPQPDAAEWYVFDDRQVYRPGETVSMKGWVRRLTDGTDSQLLLFGAGAKVAYTVDDSQGNEIGNGETAVDPLGGFDFSVVVPADANLGPANVQIQLDGADGLTSNSPNATGHSFQIEEFRRPEYEVATHAESTGPYILGTPVTVAVDATYYAGGPLGEAPVGWQVTTAGASYSPPGWDRFDFGVWTPWWLEGGRGGGWHAYPLASDSVSSEPCCFGPGTDAATEQFAGLTDADGSHYLQIDVGSPTPSLTGLPLTVSAQAAVTDVNRQQLASRTSVLVHPSSLYVGLRSDRTFVRRGEPMTVQAIVTGIDGEAVGGRRITITASRQESVFANGRWEQTDVDPQPCEVTSAAEAVECTFSTEIGGTYTVASEVTDDQGRTSRTELTRWVSGAEGPPSRNVEQEQLTVVPDREEYRPGDTAELLVQAPFGTGTGLLTVSRNGIVSTSTFTVEDGSAVVPVAVADRDIPGLDVAIEVVGATPRTADDGTALPGATPRPAFATGSLTLPISTASRALTVAVEPQATDVVPGGATSVDVTVTSSAGAPVEGSQLAVVVVDEAVLALSNYELQDPLAAFYGQLPGYIAAEYGRSSIVLTDPLTTVAGGGDGDTKTAGTTAGATAATTVPASAGERDASVPAPAATDSSAGGSAAGTAPVSTSIDVRTDFDALAVFEPTVTTDAAGHAAIDVPLPDNLTRYRVMVVAVAGAEAFGSAQANITARLPLMVRPSAPRFLNFGDSFELPVVVQNQTDAAMDVDVVIQSDNLGLAADADGGAGSASVEPGKGVGRRVTVPANDRVEVRFPASASAAGTARFRVAAASGERSDAATVTIPVYTPTTSEAFATYGVVDDGAVLQPVSAPVDVVPQFGGLDITTSSTSLQALTDAVLYLADYPYRSSDAMASRILAISSLRDVLTAFDAPGLPSPTELDAAVKADLAGLLALQNDDGGFAYWRLGQPSDPYNTVQATHALVVAKAAGIAVEQGALGRALDYLRDVEQHIPAEYGDDARDSISAYALNVRLIAGDRDATKAKALFDRRGDSLPLDAIAWLWPAISDEGTSAAIERIVSNRAVDTAGAVTFTTAVSDSDYLTLRSDRRTDGLLLDALIAVRPSSDLIPKTVAGLLASQDDGRWDNVQENSFILLAMKRYFDTYESETPDFVAKVWLGDQFAAEQSYAGRSTDRNRVTVPTSQVIEAAGSPGGADVTISKEGAGRLYYRIGLRTAPADLALQPLDRGFVVARTYEAVDDPADVRRDADGTWHIRAGAKVRVRLTMVAESRRTHVALIDPLPAGLEILNTSLATTPDVPSGNVDGGPIDGGPIDGGDGDVIPYRASYWWGQWFDHQNQRDDRAEAFATVLGAGSYDYSYVASATTPGTFVVPPTRAEEMYAPETFGRTATDTVVVDG